MVLERQSDRVTSSSFLEWIHNEDDHERINIYKENQKYYEGDLDVKIPSNIKALISKEFAFTGNLIRPVVDASVRHLAKEPPTIEVKTLEGEDTENEDVRNDISSAENFLYTVFRESKLKVKNFLKALRIQSKKGEFALKAYSVLDDDGNIQGYKISVLRPDICYPKWKDEEYEEMEYFSIKYKRTNPETGELEWFAQVLCPNEIREYTKPIGATDYEQWREINSWETNYGFIPVEWGTNKADDKPWSESDITPDLKDIQDALNKAITDLSYAIDSESFRTAFILGASPEKDPRTGEPKPLKGGPGKIHYIPSQGESSNPSLDELSPSNFQGLLSCIDKYLDIVSMITNTPKNELAQTSSGNVPTGVALRTIYQPFTGKVNEKAGLFSSALERISQKLLLMAHRDGFDTDFREGNYGINIHIKTSLPADEVEQASIHEKEDNNNWKSKETIMQERGIEDIESEKEKISDEMQEAALYGDEARIAEELDELDLEEDPEI